jgi:hypothetical protein
MDGEPRKLDGRMHNVTVYFRDYKTEHGLTIARLQETAVDGTKQTNKMTISRVSVNDAIDDAQFQKPHLATVASMGPKLP